GLCGQRALRMGARKSIERFVQALAAFGRAQFLFQGIEPPQSEDVMGVEAIRIAPPLLDIGDAEPGRAGRQRWDRLGPGPWPVARRLVERLGPGQKTAAATPHVFPRA